MEEQLKESLKKSTYINIKINMLTTKAKNKGAEAIDEITAEQVQKEAEEWFGYDFDVNTCISIANTINSEIISKLKQKKPSM